MAHVVERGLRHERRATQRRHAADRMHVRRRTERDAHQPSRARLSGGRRHAADDAIAVRAAHHRIAVPLLTRGVVMSR